MRTAHSHRISRRSLVHGAAWAVPTAMVAATAPAIAASTRIDPGINGWVQNIPTSYRLFPCYFRLEITSLVSGVTTPDGAPFGLYLYDTEDVSQAGDATLTYWVLGDHTRSDTSITWRTLQGHSSRWSGPTTVGTARKPDGKLYTGYRWTYTGAIDLMKKTVGRDGMERVFLGDFHVGTDTFRQSDDTCGVLNYWAERSITLDGEVHTFQRRAGTEGAYNTSTRRLASSPVESRSTAPAGEPTEGDEIPLEPTVC